MTDNASPGLHKCPGPLCQKMITHNYLACSGHWYQVSKHCRALVWRTWANGNGAGSEAHRMAMMRAISEMKPFKKDVR